MNHDHRDVASMTRATHLIHQHLAAQLYVGSPAELNAAFAAANPSLQGALRVLLTSRLAHQVCHERRHLAFSRNYEALRQGPLADCVSTALCHAAEALFRSSPHEGFAELVETVVAKWPDLSKPMLDHMAAPLSRAYLAAPAAVQPKYTELYTRLAMAAQPPQGCLP